MIMAKFRKKPVIIEAFRLNERGLVAEDWFWDAVTRNDIITHCFGKHEPDPAWCEIKTLEGTMIANAGDYIIQGVNGEIYPCKADIFQKTYTEDNTKTNAVTVQEWIPVEDRLPEYSNDGFADAVLVTDGFVQHMAYFVGGEWRFAESGEIKEPMWYRITHWMPLPQPPKGE